MTPAELRETRWWALWVAETGGYEPDDEAICIALDPKQRFCVLKYCGDWYVVKHEDEDVDRYSMACVPTRKEAVELCREMGWRVKR